jgi:hypothetical protein
MKQQKAIKEGRIPSSSSTNGSLEGSEKNFFRDYFVIGTMLSTNYFVTEPLDMLWKDNYFHYVMSII